MEFFKKNTQIANVSTATIIAIYLFRLSDKLFPNNYQQDDVVELEPTYFETFLCAFTWGDQHPLFSGLVWVVSQYFINVEIIISTSIVLFGVCSLILLQKILQEEFDQNTAIVCMFLLAFSPIFNTYSIALKQYNFELFCSLLCLSLIQDFEKGKIVKLRNTIYFLVLFLLSFANLISISGLIAYIFFKKVHFDKKIFLFFLVVVGIFGNGVISKVSRVVYGGYWDNFFIKFESISEFLNSFIFLNTLLMSSIVSVNLSIYLLIFFFASVIFSFIYRNQLIMFSLLMLFILYGMSSLNLYPLGGGRTDLLFLPFCLIIISNLLKFIFNKVENNTVKTSLVIIATFFIALTSSPIYYKSEKIDPIIDLLSVYYNNPDYLIVVTEEQSHSFLYYSNKEFDRNYSTKNCGVVYDINNLIIQVDGEGLNEIPTQKDVFLVGIELPGTEGQLRIVEKQLIENEYNLISETTFDDGMKLLQFKMRDS